MMVIPSPRHRTLLVIMLNDYIFLLVSCVVRMIDDLVRYDSAAVICYLILFVKEESTDTKL